MLPYPNIFTAQSKEFSQDAFIDWLLRCADPRSTSDEELLSLGRAFIDLLVNKHNTLIPELEGWNIHDHELRPIAAPQEIKSVVVRRQYLRIDVLGMVNGHAGLNIIFENKLGTGIHDDQLKRYRGLLGENHHESKENTIGVYYKVMEEKDYEEVRYTHRFCTLSREEMIAFLERYEGDNPIVVMYLDYLRGIEHELTRWRETTSEKMSAGEHWHDGMWNGFLSAVYRTLKEKLKGTPHVGLGWGWVNNTAGGFHGLWLGNWQDNMVTAYLQCDEHQLKVRMSGERTGAIMRDAWKAVCAKMEKVDLKGQAGRMQHNAGSAEIGNLGPYIQPPGDNAPDVVATAKYLLEVFGLLREITGELRESSRERK